jgi:hypothetical protein
MRRIQGVEGEAAERLEQFEHLTYDISVPVYWIRIFQHGEMVRK